MNELLKAHRHTTNNQAELEASSVCGCCSCLALFPPTEIVSWTGLDLSSFDDPQAASTAGTGVCPKCGCESLIGNASGLEVGPGLLSRMQQAWFQQTVHRKTT